MKQWSNPAFAQAALEALTKARKLHDVPRITEAVNRASLLLALTPQEAEEEMRQKFEQEKSNL